MLTIWLLHSLSPLVSRIRLFIAEYLLWSTPPSIFRLRLIGSILSPPINWTASLSSKLISRSRLSSLRRWAFSSKKCQFVLKPISKTFNTLSLNTSFLFSVTLPSTLIAPASTATTLSNPLSMTSYSSSSTLLSSEESIPKIRSPSPSLTLPPDVPGWKRSLSLHSGLDRPHPLPSIASSSDLPPLQIPPLQTRIS